MATFARKSLDSPDETRPAGTMGKVEIVQVGDLTVGRATTQPGWRWSEQVKPIVGTASCQAAHNGYIVSGRMHVVMDDGTANEVGPGDVVSIPPGHDAWTVGNEPCVMVDFTGLAQYAKPS